MKMSWVVAIFPILAVTAEKTYVGIRNFNTTTEDVRICTSFKVDDDNTYHITRFEPVAGKNIHHTIVVGCEELSTDDRYWNCGDVAASEPGYITSGHCKEINSVWMYGWAARATKAGMVIPEGFSYQVGKDTKHKYLVIEVHYGEPTISKSVDDSDAGFYLTYDKKPATNTELAMLDVKTLYTNARIPAKKKTNIEMVGKASAAMRPLLFHVHVHDLGKKVSGYVIKRNLQNPNSTTWIKIGSQSPPYPQDYFPVDLNVRIDPGDLIGLRCTFYNYNDYDMKLGPKESDEMCEFGILYATEKGNALPSIIAGEAGDWSKMNLTNIPAEA